MDTLLFRKLIDALGRFCLATVFVIAVPVKITKFSVIVGSIASRGIPEPMAAILLICAIAFIICGSVLLVFGKNQKLGASLLLIFLIPTTIIFHLFPFESKAVFMNLGLIGGLTLALTRPKMPEGNR